MTDIDNKALEGKLDAALESLLSEVAGSRSTLRIDDPERGWSVDFVCAEALRQDVRSLRDNGSIDQRAAETVKWLAKNRRNLIQPDLTGDPKPAPPPALISAYAAKAQMLGPLLNVEGSLIGWISVHYVDGPREITPADVGALDRARKVIAQMVGI